MGPIPPAMVDCFFQLMEGFCAPAAVLSVHLCLPYGNHADETVKRWIWVRTIYRADLDRPPLWPLPDRPRPVAPPVVLIPPMVGIRTSQS